MTTSNESAPTTSSAQQPAGFGNQIRSSLLSNLAAAVGAVWSVFLFVGGLIFLVYFASIGFMPEIDLQTSVVLLAVSALTGGFLLIVLSLFLLGPGLLWAYGTINNEKLKPLWYKDEEFLPTHAMLWFSLPISFVIVGFLFSGSRLGVAVLIVSLVAPLLFLYRQLPDSRNSKQRWATIGAFYWSFIFSSIAFLSPLLLLYGFMSQAPDLGKHAIFNFPLALITVVMANAVLATATAFSLSRYLFIAALAIFGIIGWSFFPNRVMSIYKFGNVKNASLVLDEIGCVIAKLHGLTVTPYTPDPKPDSPNQKMCALPSVMIHSRLGNAYYLEVSRSRNTSVRSTIPGQNVLSWAVNESKMATISGPPTSTHNPAPTTDTTPPNKDMEPTP